MARLLRILLAALVGVVITAPAAAAAPDRKLESLLGDLWETALETPTPLDPCVDLDKNVVAPFQVGPGPLTCTVKSGTKIFVAAFTVECSTAEVGTVFFGANEAELRACVRAFNPAAITITVDGRMVPLTVVETRLLHVDLPLNNILGVPAGPADSVGRGFVALLQPLPPGTHHIVINAVDAPFFGTFTSTTTIVVQPGQSRAA
jgi:hypothetical protein